MAKGFTFHILLKTNTRNFGYGYIMSQMLHLLYLLHCFLSLRAEVKYIINDSQTKHVYTLTYCIYTMIWFILQTKHKCKSRGMYFI